MARKVIAAMSGGVDSSAAALLLHQHGWDVMGVTMKFYDNEDLGIRREKTCCSLSDVEDARAVCARLGIAYYVFRYEEDFRRDVMDAFVREYEQGRTPNPCIVCNQKLKFGKLLERARLLGFSFVATGHYARIRQREDGRFLLYKAADAQKDQTYMLYSLNQDQLSHSVFPLGDYTKEQTRNLAEQYGLVTARKRDSQDICFVQNGSYADFIERYTGKTFPEGEFVDESGKVLGIHKGLIRYTIGQRKGLGLALPAPLYVKELDTVHNRVVLCPEEHLYSAKVYVKNVNLIPYDVLSHEVRCEAKIRYSQRTEKAKAQMLDDGRLLLTFDAPQRAVTPGQSAVLYQGDLVLGGGIIEKAETPGL